jgi:hypothetical protein
MISGDILKSIPPSYDNLLEFVNEITIMMVDKDNEFHRIKHEKVLLISAFNATKSINVIFNTRCAEYWPYRIADVLKATMTGSIYFPPLKISKGIIENGCFILLAVSRTNLSFSIFSLSPTQPLFSISLLSFSTSIYIYMCMCTG